MKQIQLKTELAESLVSAENLKKVQDRAAAAYEEIMDGGREADVKGWLVPQISPAVMDTIRSKAAEVRKNADVFVIVGVGGSNQAARAVIKALDFSDQPKILYAGNSLSAHYLAGVLDQLKGKSVYIDVIAKNFETLEPGSHFRVLRKCMEKWYGPDELSSRIIVTGTYGTRFEEIAKENGYTFLPFPDAIGGRYSAFSPVGLFPMAVAGIDIDRLLSGVNDMAAEIRGHADNSAVRYAVLRNALYRQDYTIEMLVNFEPQLNYFSKWWVQLFGESEGKDKTGIYPASASYSEDLHSMGQYMQDGRRDLMETFISVENPSGSVVVEADKAFRDGFDYLDGMDFRDINRAAEKATLEAHSKGGVACIQVVVPEISAYTFGQLFYFFMFACAVSGKLLGVNPFDQEGVEEYKRNMFKKLGKQ